MVSSLLGSGRALGRPASDTTTTNGTRRIDSRRRGDPVQVYAEKGKRARRRARSTHGRGAGTTGRRVRRRDAGPATSRKAAMPAEPCIHGCSARAAGRRCGAPRTASGHPLLVGDRIPVRVGHPHGRGEHLSAMHRSKWTPARRRAASPTPAVPQQRPSLSQKPGHTLRPTEGSRRRRSRAPRRRRDAVDLVDARGFERGNSTDVPVGPWHQPKVTSSRSSCGGMIIGSSEAAAAAVCQGQQVPRARDVRVEVRTAERRTCDGEGGRGRQPSRASWVQPRRTGHHPPRPHRSCAGPSAAGPPRLATSSPPRHQQAAAASRCRRPRRFT